MRKALSLFTLGLAVWGINTAAQALGIGRTANSSALGQGLNFVAAVQVDAGEALTARCVFAQVLAGDVPVRADRVRILVEPGNDARQQRVRVVTTAPIVEPVVKVNLTVGCGSRVSRNFVTLIDPPTRVQSDPLELDAPVVRAADAGGAVITAPNAADAAPASPRLRRDAAVRVGRASAKSAVAAAPKLTAPATLAMKRASLAAVKLPTASSPRPASTPPTAIAHAVLSAPPPATWPASVGPGLLAADGKAGALATRVDAALNTRAAPARTSRPAPTAAPANVQSAQADHVRELEPGVVIRRNDSASSPPSLAALQARVHDVADARFTSPLVLTLGGVALLLLGIVAAVWKPRPKRHGPAATASMRTEAAPIRAAAPKKRAAPPRLRAEPPTLRAEPPVLRAEPPMLRDTPVPAMRPTPSTPPNVPEPMGAMEKTRPIRAGDTDASVSGLEVTTVIDAELHARVKRSSRREGAATSAAFASLGAPETRGHGPSMEELIDIEQRAEFYLALGQEEAAIALLDKHIASGGGSPLPFLKLLEIHHRRQDEVSYNQIRTSFNERFKAYAPEWSKTIELGRALEEYPATLENVQSAWDAPLRAMKMLDSLLFRRSANEDAFDFAAYRELLFLYSIARDLSGDVMAPAMGSDIDLLLPLDEASIALLSRRMKPVLPMISANAERIGGFDIDGSTLARARLEQTADAAA